jgi:hypothetical protein
MINESRIESYLSQVRRHNRKRFIPVEKLARSVLMLHLAIKRLLGIASNVRKKMAHVKRKGKDWAVNRRRFQFGLNHTVSR